MTSSVSKCLAAKTSLSSLVTNTFYLISITSSIEEQEENAEDMFHSSDPHSLLTVGPVHVLRMPAIAAVIDMIGFSSTVLYTSRPRCVLSVRLWTR